MSDFVIENGEVKYIGKDSIVYIPEDLDEDLTEAFIDCPFIKKIVIPKTLEILGLSGLVNLEEIEVDPDNPFCSSLDNILYNKDQTEVFWCPEGRKGDVVLPNTVVTIGNYAFKGCNKLKTIFIPSSVKYLIDTPFFECNAEIIIDPESKYFVSYDGVIYTKNMFHLVHCATNKEGTLVLPKSVIGSYYAAFVGCSKLTSIEYTGYCIIGFGDYAFDGCESLESIIIPSDVLNLNDNDTLGRIFVVKIKDDYLENPDEVRDFIVPRTKAAYFEGPLEMAVSTDFYRFIVDANDCSIELFYKNENSEYVRFLFKDAEENSMPSNYFDFEIDENGELYAYNGPDKIDLIIPSNVKSVYEEAFGYDIVEFNSIFIPESLVKFSWGLGLLNVNEFIVDPNNKAYSSIDGDLYSKDGTILYRASVKEGRGCFEVPGKVKIIDWGAFYSCSFDTIIIHSSVKSLYSITIFEKISSVIIHVSPELVIKVEDFDASQFNYFKEIYFEMDLESAKSHQLYSMYIDAKTDEEITTKLFYLKNGEYIPFS